MKVKFKYEYDKSNDALLSPKINVQVILAKGIFGNCRQHLKHFFIFSRSFNSGLTIRAFFNDI